MIKVFHSLNINPDDTNIGIITGPSAQGKTTTATLIVKELVDLGKKVYFITDDGEDFIHTKLKNINCNLSDKNLLKHSTVKPFTFKLSILKQNLGKKPFDYVIIDVALGKDEINLLLDYAREKKQSILLTKSAIMMMDSNRSHYNSGFDRTTVDKCDIVIGVYKQLGRGLTFTEELLNLVRPIIGLKKYTQTNTSLTLIKNKRGGLNKKLVKFDYRKLHKNH